MAAQRRSTSRRRQDKWHVDHTISIPSVLVLLIQVCSGVWWFSTLNSRVTVLEKTEVKLSQDVEHTINQNRDEFGVLRDRTTRTETLISNLEQTLKNLNNSIAELNRTIHDKK